MLFCFSLLQVNFATVKKAVVAIIALLYLVSASGVVVDIHYCMNDLTAEKKEGCCATKSKWVKLQDAHQHVKLPKQFKQLSGEASIPKLAVTDKWMRAGEYYALKHFIAPPFQENDLYLHNCVFRI